MFDMADEILEKNITDIIDIYNSNSYYEIIDCCDFVLSVYLYYIVAQY